MHLFSRLAAPFAFAAALAAFPVGSIAARAEPPAGIATAVVTIVAAAPSEAVRADMLGMATAGRSHAPKTGYSYVVYFPAGTDTLTGPARQALTVIASEIRALELSRVTLSDDGDRPGRIDAVRAALVARGVPARWIGNADPQPDPGGPVSLTRLAL